ncbi:MAG: hypothetical protein ACLSGI_04300 [Butyricicoccaceae bacterium]
MSIMDCCGQGDLVLFDELGAGTDPVEGAAPGGCRYRLCPPDGRVRCRHHALRRAENLALTTDGVEDASCEFDVKSLQPTVC